MDLSRSQLDLVSTRKLVECLDHGSALGAVGTWIRSLKDEELLPLITSVNRTFLNQPDLLFALERSFSDMDEQGVLRPTLASVGQLLNQDEWIDRSIRILKKIYAPTGKLDPQLLQALAKLSTLLTEEKVSDAIDLAILLTSAPSFSSLWHQLTLTEASQSRPLDPAISQGLVNALRAPTQWGKELMTLTIQGHGLKWVDRIIPSDPNEIKTAIPRLASIMDVTLAHQARIAHPMSLLFEALQKPVSCLQGARAMKHVSMDMLRDLSAIPSSQAASFIQRDRLLEIYLTSPWCTFPTELSQHYPALMELASSAAIEPLADVLRVTYQIGPEGAHPIADFFIRALSDPAFRSLLPALSELTQRAGWTDLLFLATTPQIRDHAKWVDLLKFFIEPMPTPLGAAPASIPSIYDAFVGGFSNINTPGLAQDLSRELDGWLKSFAGTEMGLDTTFKDLRSAYLINNIHPVIGLLQSTLANAPSDPALIETLLKIAAHPEFRSMVRELGQMAAAHDGRLQDLIQTSLNLFHRYAAKGFVAVETRPAHAIEPKMRILSHHHWTSDDVAPLRGANGVSSFNACKSIDLATPWNSPSSTDASRIGQLHAAAGCINGDGNYADFSEALDFLAQTQTDDPTVVRSFYSLMIESYNNISLSTPDLHALTDWGMAAINDGRVLRGLKALPFWASQNLNQDIITPLIALAGPVITDFNVRNGIKRLGLYGAQVLQKPVFQPLLVYLDDLWRLPPRELPSEIRTLNRIPYDKDRILRWISNKECSTLPPDGMPSEIIEAAKTRRLRETLDEYEHAAINHGPLIHGKLRREWTTRELKTELEPIFGKLGNSKDNGPLIQALLRFAARFNDRTQYPKDFLENWLKRLASDRRLLSYIYPGQTRPQVRLVNGLDRLGLVLLNSDIYAPDPINMNFGMQFLANIAEAWGDVPFENRPPAIQALYPKTGHKKCPTLAEAVQDILETAQTFYELVGFPALPKCTEVPNPNDPPDVQKDETSNPTSDVAGTDDPDVAKLQISMYNISETVGILREITADGSIRVLRDLFFDLYYTGPADHRDSNAGLNNNLSVAVRLVRTGLLRQIGIALENSNSRDPAVHSIFQVMMEGSASPFTESVLRQLLANDSEHELIWNVLGEVLALHTTDDIAHAKNTGLYLIGAIDSLGKAKTGADGPNELLNPGLRALEPILTQYRDFIAHHTDLVGDVLKSENLGHFLQNLSFDRDEIRPDLLDLAIEMVSDSNRGLDLMAILSSIQSSPQPRQDWDQLKTRWDALDAVPGYVDLDITGLARSGLFFLEGRKPNGDSAPFEEAEISRRVLLQVASALERNDMELVDQLLVLAGRHPESVTALIRSLARMVEHGEVPHLLDLLQKTLEKPQ
ncbi:hypothetical protein WDW37_04620 [Bdellovibrionota bacterium FG-1]